MRRIEDWDERDWEVMRDCVLFAVGLMLALALFLSTAQWIVSGGISGL